MLPQPIFSFEKFGDLDTIVKLKRVQRWVTYFCTQPLYVPTERKRTTAKLSSKNEPPTICRIPLHYIQQMAGVSHQGIFQKITSEFSEIYISEAQLRRYIVT